MYKRSVEKQFVMVAQLVFASPNQNASSAHGACGGGVGLGLAGGGCGVGGCGGGGVGGGGVVGGGGGRVGRVPNGVAVPRLMTVMGIVALPPLPTRIVGLSTSRTSAPKSTTLAHATPTRWVREPRRAERRTGWANALSSTRTRPWKPRSLLLITTPFWMTTAVLIGGGGGGCDCGSSKGNRSLETFPLPLKSQALLNSACMRAPRPPFRICKDFVGTYDNFMWVFTRNRRQRAAQRMALPSFSNDGLSTGCSMNSRKTTLAIISSTSVEQLPAALAMAAKVLKPAAAINNSPQLAIFGTGLADARPSAVETVKLLKSIAQAKNSIRIDAELALDRVHLIVGAHDLTMLRFVPSARLGEVCRIPGCTDATLECAVAPSVEEMGEDAITAAIECIRRLPAVSYASEGDLPFEWKEHVQNVRTFDWLRDLWTETLKRRKQAAAKQQPMGELAETPFDVISLAMYAKMVSTAFRTTAMAHETLQRVVSTIDGAEGLGLTALFPRDGIAPSVLTFLSGYLVGDQSPWRVTRRGREAATKARVVLQKVYKHANVVLELLRHSKVAEVVRTHATADDEPGEPGEPGEGVLLVQGGPMGVVGKLIVGRLPVSASASNHKLTVQFAKPKGGWVGELNSGLHEVVSVLSESDAGAADARAVERVRARIGAYAALASGELEHRAALDDVAMSTALAMHGRRAVTTFPNGVAAHIARELVIKERFVQVDSTTACVAVQSGTSVSCTFLTFCPGTVASLRGPAFAAPAIAASDVLTIQRAVDAIASSIDRPYRPLGVLSGTLGPVVMLDDEEHRVCYWRNRGETRDSIVSFFPSAYTAVVFADYATGSRDLRASETVDDTTPPFFVADSVFALSVSSALPGSNGCAYSVPTLVRTGFIGAADEPRLYKAYMNGVASSDAVNVELPSALDGAFRVLYVRETEDDRLNGLCVQWSRQTIADAAGEPRTMFALVSGNSAREQLLY